MNPAGRHGSAARARQIRQRRAGKIKRRVRAVEHRVYRIGIAPRSIMIGLSLRRRHHRRSYPAAELPQLCRSSGAKGAVRLLERSPRCRHEKYGPLVPHDLSRSDNAARSSLRLLRRSRVHHAARFYRCRSPPPRASRAWQPSPLPRPTARAAYPQDARREVSRESAAPQSATE